MSKAPKFLLPICVLIGCFIGVFGAAVYISNKIMVELAPAIKVANQVASVLDVEKVNSIVGVIEQLEPMMDAVEQLESMTELVQKLESVTEMAGQLDSMMELAEQLNYAVEVADRLSIELGETGVSANSMVAELLETDIAVLEERLTSSMTATLNTELEGAVQPLSDDFYIVLEEFNTVLSNMAKLEKRLDSVIDDMQPTVFPGSEY